MNQKKATREKTKFSKLRLPSSSKSNKLCSPRSQEKISSYFSSVLDETENTSNETKITANLESSSGDELDVIKLRGTKSSESTTFESCTDDTNDFTKPKISNITSKLKSKSSRIENITKRKTQNVSKPKIDHLNYDTNQEHLELAIAMSKSISEVENVQTSESELNEYPSTQQKINNVKQTLDQFGFKSGKKSILINSKPNTKSTKWKKHKYCTPVLFLRTEEDRTKIIENKVSQIINNISIYNKTTQNGTASTSVTSNKDNKPRSFILRDYYKEKPALFNKNALCLASAQDNEYYNGIVVPSKVRAGVLLKDWLTIPGRESSPRLEETVSTTQSLEFLDVPPPREISMSPELFADSDEDDLVECSEQNHYSRKEVINDTNKENILESDGSNKSVSLLDESTTKRNRTSALINNVPAPRTESLSLSPFLDIYTRDIIAKPIKTKCNVRNKNDENSDSLSPFESVCTETKKSPKRKVTPKKKTPSPKKHVITPKSRKLISFDNLKKSSTCRRSISFTDMDNVEKIPNNSNKNSDICHFESFSSETIECFDLTHSSDDEGFILDKANDNERINEMSPERIESTTDSQASIETIKLNIPNGADTHLNEDFSPEFDCLNLSNNRVFYETLNNSLLFQNDDDLEPPEKQLQEDVITIHSEENESNPMHENTEYTCTPIAGKNMDNNYSFLLPDSSSDKKGRSLSLRRSFSTSSIDNKIIKQTTSLRKSFRLSLDNIDKQDEMERHHENISLSQSSTSNCSDINDEELNYSCSSIYKRCDSSDKISISDEADNREDEELACVAEHEPVHYPDAVHKTLCSVQHPRVSMLSTPLKGIKSSCSNSRDDSLIGETGVGSPETGIIINRENVTPKGHYSDMDTPEINRQLEKYGLKAMKRSKGAKFLRYIYDSTHPYENNCIDDNVQNSSSDDEGAKATKRRKTKSQEVNHEKFSVITNDEMAAYCFMEQNGNEIVNSEKPENMIFERKLSKTISSCRVPLHLVWYNLLINSKELQESVLTYTPVQLEEIYAQIKNLGYKFHKDDIKAFLDKKCITIRIAQNNRNRRR